MNKVSLCHLMAKIGICLPMKPSSAFTLYDFSLMNCLKVEFVHSHQTLSSVHYKMTHCSDVSVDEPIGRATQQSLQRVLVLPPGLLPVGQTQNTPPGDILVPEPPLWFPWNHIQSAEDNLRVFVSESLFDKSRVKQIRAWGEMQTHTKGLH